MVVILFGATGMVGTGVLLECLDDPRITRVLSVARSPLDITHPRLQQIVHKEFFDYAGIQSQFAGADACFFCLGVSSVGMKADEYFHLTYDLTMAAATAIAAVTERRMTFCYVTGEGTDSTEHGGRAWARAKGKTENALLRMPFKAAYMFRPGYIQPLRGIRSKTRWYQAVYDVLGLLYPLLRRLAPRFVTTTVNIGLAMIEVTVNGYEKPILATPDINAAAARAAARSPRAAGE